MMSNGKQRSYAPKEGETVWKIAEGEWKGLKHSGMNLPEYLKDFFVIRYDSTFEYLNPGVNADYVQADKNYTFLDTNSNGVIGK